MTKPMAVCVLLALFMFSTLRLDVLLACSAIALTLSEGYERLRHGS